MMDPLADFTADWQLAQTQKLMNARYCSLATVGLDGRPVMRTVVLRGVSDGALVLFVSASSPKWQQLKNNGNFEILVFWPELLRQYRLGGNQLRELSAVEMQGHWQRKPYDAKILDLYYVKHQAQSTAVDSREAFLAEIAKLKADYPSDQDIPLVDNALGLQLSVNFIERWQVGEGGEMHQRTLWTQTERGWKRQFLVP
ncbi:pyridoxamine 5'-phosphate oxidase family protein [Zhongshania sp.]|uniref:pyridoxamine 5'-phosphate oxidase family protein n=1 Tax=Zhongshania sp. TaxID=1971902 RepID=UPI003569E57D